jgi:hypothetical protein
MSAYMNHGKTTSAKRYSWWKSTLTESDCHVVRRIVSKNHRTTAAQMTVELNIHLEDPVSTKLFNMSFRNPTSMVGLQLPNLWLLKLLLRCVNNAVTTIKHQTTGNACMIWPDELSFTLFPTSRIVYIWGTPKEAYNLECLVPTVKHWGGSVMV